MQLKPKLRRRQAGPAALSAARRFQAPVVPDPPQASGRAGKTPQNVAPGPPTAEENSP